VTAHGPTNPLSGPDDAALLEYGRLIWAAISLEDVVYHMGDAFGMDASALKAKSVSSAIKDMRKELAQHPEWESAEKARQWLGIAQDMLGERNKVVHVVPGTLVTIKDDHAVTRRGPVLEYIGRQRGSYLQTPMTVEGLDPIRQRIEQARAGWVDVFMALAADYESCSSPEV
jgi:hypothetical protein